MKKRIAACLLTAVLVLAGCGAQKSGDVPAGTSSAAETESGDVSGTTDSTAAESTADDQSSAAESIKTDSESAGTDSSTESTAGTESTEPEESESEAPKAPDVSPDAIPVSPESFSTLGPDSFITLAPYKDVVQIYPEEAVITSGVIANINFSGIVEGETEPRDGMVGEGYDLKVGSGTFIPGFEDMMIGHRKGETVVFELAFPADYSNTELAGKNTTWTVLINLLKTDSDEVFNNIVAESIVTAYPQDVYNAIDAIGAFDNEDLKKAYTRRWLTAKAILYKEGITEEDPTYQSIESMILLTMGNYASEADAVAAGYSSDLIRYYVEYYMACQVIEDNFKR